MTVDVDALVVYATGLAQLDTNQITDSVQYDLASAAVERYGQDRPDEITTDVTGTGARYYAVTGLTSWAEGYSKIVSIEYPAIAIASNDVPTYLDPDDWSDDYWVSGVRYIFLPNHAPASTETMRIRYTAPYTKASGAYSQISSRDFYAIGHLLASMMCQSVATRYSKTTDSGIAADAIGHTSRAGEFASRARELEKYYLQHMELDKSQDIRPAGEFINWDTDAGDGRRRYLFRGAPR